MKRQKLSSMLTINGVSAKVLISSKASDDFIGNHFVTVKKLPLKKRDIPLSIQLAVK